MAAVDIENVPMMCFQCEQTAKGEACTVRGVCQKTAEVAGLQDYLMAAVQALCSVAHVKGAADLPAEIERFIPMAIFSTLTNTNFAPDDFVEMSKRATRYRDELLSKLGQDERAKVPKIGLEFRCADTMQAMEAAARDYLISRRFRVLGKDRVCLQELMVYGVKGISAYIFHAIELGAKSGDVVAAICKLIGHTLQQPDPSVEFLLSACMETGQVNLRAMELLDDANTRTYGHPEPTRVQWIQDAANGSEKPGKAILVTGHDLRELQRLLQQCEGKGVNVYTHGEMLPCNAYPGLKSYKCLAGHYGTAWQNQKKEFAEFPGPIVLTTNCYIPAPDSYVGRVFSLEPVGGVSVKRLHGGDFSEVIAAAQAMDGFGPKKGPTPGGKLDELTIGFARNTVMSVADKVIGAVKAGALKRIFLIGGCDGFERERNQFTDFAAKVPDDCIILTLACGKFKINGRSYGTLGGLPRLLDMGQCNDAFSAIQVAVALVKAFGLSSVNDLPLSLMLSWFEQKAVAILLTLLSLGITNIYVGPRLPAFFTPTILDVLVSKFKLHHFTDADKAMDEIMGTKK